MKPAENLFEETAAALGVSESRLRKDFGEKKIQYVEKPFPHLRFSHGVHALEKGLVVFGGEPLRVFPGYHKMKRIMFLDQNLSRYFDDEIEVEEKLNGYNVRIGLVGEKLVVLTRGGLICPYTNAMIKARLEGNGFFEDHDEKILCAEVVGKRNPYVQQDYDEVGGFGFYVFDVIGEKGLLPVDEKKYLCKSYGLPHVPCHGRVSPEEPEKIKKTVKELDEKGREGVVLKDPLNQKSPLKYTCFSSTLSDLKSGSKVVYATGKDYFFRRVVRAAFQALEQEVEDFEAAHMLGENLLLPIIESVREVQSGEEVGEEFELRIREPLLSEFLEYLDKQGIKVEYGKRKDMVWFKKIDRSTSDTFKGYLEGQAWKEQG